ncbi:MAG: protein required for attachment to host cells [Paraglaciecola sp.]|jgi:protein required for attachment to host cells
MLIKINVFKSLLVSDYASLYGDLKMNKNVVVVADSVCPRIFTSDSARSPLTEVETLLNPQGRLHERDMTSDLPGRSSCHDGSAGYTFDSRATPKKHQLAGFARVVGSYINAVRTANNISSLVLIAEPPFLGELRIHLSNESTDKVIFELNKNLTKQSPEGIFRHLSKRHIH